MKLTIHKGTKEIGGSCVEISTDKAKVIIDFGIPLIGENGNSFDSNKLKGMTKEELIEQNIVSNIQTESKDIALLISHAHPDHYGLLNYLPPATPVYASEITKSIIDDISPILYKTKYNVENFKILKNKNYCEIGDIKVKAHSVDHSIADSLAFEITDGIKTILYTGDFRAHGRKKHLFNQLTANLQDKINYMILEGTTLGRKESQALNEDELEKKLTGLFQTKKLNLIIFSAQNLDRFISVYKACLKTKKTLVIDPYTAYLLEKFQVLGKKIPQYSWNNIKIYFAPNSITKHLAETKELYKYKEQKISIEQILSIPEKYVVKDNRIISENILKLMPVEQIQVIYSLWSGYLEKEDNFWNKYKDNIIQLHTSGHASIEDLKSFVDQIKPKKLIPIHTLYPELYQKTFDSEVIALKDKQEYEL